MISQGYQLENSGKQYNDELRQSNRIMLAEASKGTDF